MPAESPAPLRYAVNRLNWQRTNSGFVRKATMSRLLLTTFDLGCNRFRRTRTR
jgi:hypothetical protein